MGDVPIVRHLEKCQWSSLNWLHNIIQLFPYSLGIAYNKCYCGFCFYPNICCCSHCPVMFQISRASCGCCSSSALSLSVEEGKDFGSG